MVKIEHRYLKFHNIVVLSGAQGACRETRLKSLEHWICQSYVKTPVSESILEKTVG